MPTTEAQVNIAAKLYEARRVLRRLMPDEYAERIKTWMEMVATRTAGGDYLRTGMTMMQALQDRQGDGMAQLYLLAAVVELIEPDEQTPKTEAA